MCVAYCHRLGVLYWNHADCHPLECELAETSHERCESCRHQQDEICALTNAPLPDDGCCHHNVEPVTGPQEVSREMLAPLGIGVDESELYLLRSLEVPYRLTAQAQVLIEPDELGLPFTYGRGTEHRPEEVFDWSDWFGRWCREED